MFALGFLKQYLRCYIILELLDMKKLLVLFVFLAANSTSAETVPELDLDYEKFTLDNGLRIVVHEDRKAPIVAVGVWYHVGSKNEPPGKTGFAHLFEHLMFNGSENYDGEWFEPMQQVGATTLNGTTWLDRTNYFQTVPTPALDLVLWLESDRMGHLLGAVTQEKLDNQIGVVQNEKRQGDNQPYGRVNYNLYKGLFPPGHPYRHSTIGSMSDLDNASLEDVHEWFKNYYGPNNAVLAIVGDIDAVTAKTKVEKYFGDIPAGPEVDVIQAWRPTKDHNTLESQYDNVPAVMANRGWVIPERTSRDWALLDLAASILGEGRNSRFYVDLVYERQLASSVNIGVMPFELAGVFDLSITLNPGESPEVASAAMDRILKEFIADGPELEELERVVTAINAKTIRGLERIGGFGGKATILAEGELYADDPAFVKQYLKWVNQATPSDVKKVVRKWLGDGWHQVNVLPIPEHNSLSRGVNRSSGLPDIPDELTKLTFPNIKRARLTNGVEVVLAQRTTVPLVEMSMYFDAGYAADGAGNSGVASFATEMLDLGTKRRSALEISAEAEILSAKLSADSNLDATTVSLSALTSHLEDSIELWADVIQYPIFDEVEIERLRGRRLAEIAQEKAQPRNLALRLLPPALYGGDHPYGIPYTGSGTEASIQSIHRDDLVRFHKDWLNSANATIYAVGDTNLDQLVAFLEHAFRDWKTPADKPRKEVADVRLPESPRIVIIDKPDAPQSLILGGHVVPGLGTQRDLAINAMNAVLGASFNARINMNLREGKGWAYGARTMLLSARGPRLLLVYAPVQTDRTGNSIAELIRELRSIRGSRPVEASEMQRVIAGLTRELPGRFETAGAVLNSMLESATYGRALDYPASLAERYSALSLTDLQHETRILHPGSVLWLVVGDLSKIRSQIEVLDIAPIEIWDADGNAIGGG